MGGGVSEEPTEIPLMRKSASFLIIQVFECKADLRERRSFE